MSDPRLDEWLRAAGFDPIGGLDIADPDDPWGDVDIDVTPLTDDQRAFLSGTPTFDDGPLDASLLAEADTVVIEFPDDPDEIEPF